MERAFSLTICILSRMPDPLAAMCLLRQDQFPKPGTDQAEKLKDVQEFLFLSWSDFFLPTHCRCRRLFLQLITLNETYANHTRYDSSGGGIGPSLRTLPDNKRISQETHISFNLLENIKKYIKEVLILLFFLKFNFKIL